MALFYVLGGINHFVSVDRYMALMPDYLPYHLELVYISGLAEIVLGFGLLVPKLQRMAAWGIILLLFAVFPANVYHLMSGGAGMNIPLWALWLRLPLQLVLIYWAYQYTKKPYTFSMQR